MPALVIPFIIGLGTGVYFTSSASKSADKMLKYGAIGAALFVSYKVAKKRGFV